MLSIVRGPDYKSLAKEFVASFSESIVGDFDDLFEPAWVITPSRAIQRWLGLQYTMGVDGAEGVAANWRHELPGSLFTLVLDADWATHGDRPEDPWELSRLSHHLFTLALNAAGRPDKPSWYSKFVGGDPTSKPSFGRAAYFADLFDRYHRWSPALIERWNEGHDRDEPQAAMWRDLRRAIGVESPAERLPRALAALQAGTVELPAKSLSIFGLAQFPGGGSFVEIVAALSTQVDVALYLVDPSPALDGVSPVQLLELWGKSIRQSHRYLDELRAAVPESTFNSCDSAITGSSALSTLQRWIRTNATDAVVSPQDSSIEIHDCAGPARQVEVARELVLRLLAEGYAEEEILIVAPDLATFEPLLRSTFGPSRDFGGYSPSNGGGLPPISYRVVDPSTERTVEFKEAVTRLFDLLISRFDVVETFAFVEEPEVLARFGLAGRSAPIVRAWMERAKTSWGLSAVHREVFGVRTPEGLPSAPNSLEALLQRLHLGLAIDERGDRLFDGIAPLEVDIDDLSVVAYLSEVLAVLGVAAAEVRTTKTQSEWLEWIHQLTAALLRPQRGGKWQGEELDAALEDMRTKFVDPGAEVEFGDVRAMLERVWAKRTAPTDLFGAAIMVVPPATLRFIEHRAVIILGFDEGAFEGGRAVLDDLLLAAAAGADVLSPAEEARGGLLALLLQASEKLLITRTGRHLRDNSHVESAIAMDELLDGLRQVTNTDRRNLPVRSTLHRRHGFSPANFDPAEQPIWSFNTDALAIAQRVLEGGSSRQIAPVGVQGRQLEVSIQQVAKVLTDPLEQFAKLTLGVRFPTSEEAFATEVPVVLSGLDKWTVVHALIPGAASLGMTTPPWLEAVDHRAVVRNSFDRLAAEGVTPIEPVWAERDELVIETDALQRVAAMRLACSSVCEAVEIRYEVKVGQLSLRLVDTVGCHDWQDGGRGPLFVTNSKYSNKKRHLVRTALALLALHAQDQSCDTGYVVFAMEATPKQKREGIGRAEVVRLTVVQPSDGDTSQPTILDALAFGGLCLEQRMPLDFTAMLTSTEETAERAMRPRELSTRSFGDGEQQDWLATWMVGGLPDDVGSAMVVSEVLKEDLALIASEDQVSLAVVAHRYLAALFGDGGAIEIQKEAVLPSNTEDES